MTSHKLQVQTKDKNLNRFDRDYYEDGVRKGISGYEDYRWMPTRSLPEALEIKKKFVFDSKLISSIKSNGFFTLYNELYPNCTDNRSATNLIY